MKVADALRWWAATVPEQPAVSFAGDIVTYAELDAWTNTVAAVLLSDTEPGERVGMIAGNSLEWCVAALAALKAGAVFTPFNSRLVPRELRVVVSDCTPALMFFDHEHEPLLSELGDLLDGVRTLKLERDVAALRGVRHSYASPETDPDSPNIIVYTSGSTGRPKGVIFTHQTTAAQLFEWSLIEPTYRPGVRKLMQLPLYTAAGTLYNVCRLVLHGGTLYLESRFDPEVALRLVTEHQIESMSGPPIVFERIAALPGFAAADLSSVTHAQVGGARVTHAVLSAWHEKGVALRQLYGLTEAGGLATLAPPDRTLTHPAQCGRGGVFTRLRVVDPEGRDCPPGMPGQILVKGPSVTPGYWGNPQATSEALIDGWLHTGDVGVLDEEGYLTYHDRLKEMIISGGLNISPVEVENVVSEYPGVEEVSVISVPDERFGETPAAIVRPSGPLAIQDLIAHCNANLSDYKVPRYVVLTDDPLPRLASGKIAKQEVRRKWADLTTLNERVR